MTLLFFEIENENGITNHYSVFLNLDWLDEYLEKNGYGDIGKFLKEYNSEDVQEIISELDYEGEPYTIQEEHQFSVFAD